LPIIFRLSDAVAASERDSQERIVPDRGRSDNDSLTG